MSSIRYVAPLDRALQHMRTMLFRPFAAKKWLVIAFAAWLADLGSGGGGGPSSTFDASDAVRKSWGAADAGLLPPGLSGPFSEWSSSSAFFGLSVLALGLVVIGAVLLALLVLWISARGKFIFLDCVIHDRAAIKAPWSRYRQQGNSLFLWNLAWITAGMLAVSAVAAAVMLGGLLSGLLSGFEPGVAPIIGLVLAAALPVIPLLYLFLWIESFVVPIMYRREIAILEALKEFWGLLSARPAPFVLYGLFYLLMLLCVFFVVIALVVLTCGVGALLLIIPYVGAVVMLPISITLRAYSLAWLEQIDPRYGLSVEPGAPPQFPDPA